MKRLFGKLFGDHPKPQVLGAPVQQSVSPNNPQTQLPELYKRGDVIGGLFEIYGILGKGGFGVVFVAYNRETREICALKTFKEELLSDPSAREAFKKEALLWVNLESHPFICAALWVREVSGRLFVAMEQIGADSQGRVSLTGHLDSAGKSLDPNQALKWAIQFCVGMEHANARGVKCHRDIKPENILITPDGTLKISDFGLAAAAQSAWCGATRREESLVTGSAESGFGLSLMQAGGKMRCGTPGYIAPEVYRYEGADIRSDIYSFGLVLWQMAVGSRVPPWNVPWRGEMESYLRAIYEEQMSATLPRTDGPLGAVIQRCLQPRPSDRFSTFQELRRALQPIWEEKAGRTFEMPQTGEHTVHFWNNKGDALDVLGQHEEAIRCFDKALAINARHVNAWNNKSNALHALGRLEEAIECCDKALAFDPRSVPAWANKGGTLRSLGRLEEAIRCYDKALAINPQNSCLWTLMGNAFQALQRNQEAIGCFDKSLAIDPRDTIAWNNKGGTLQTLGRYEDAILCHDKALAIDPLDAKVWYNKGNALRALGRREDEIGCCNKALAINPQYAAAWYNKALSEYALQRWTEAMGSYRKFVELAPPQYAQQVARARQRLIELESKAK